MVFFINFNNNIIFKLNIWFSVIKFFIKRNIFMRKKFDCFFCYWCFFSNHYVIVIISYIFLNSMAFSNLQCSIISRVNFSIIKTPSTFKKCFLFLFFFFCDIFCFFYRNIFWFCLTEHHQYLNAQVLFQYHSFHATIQLHFFLHYVILLF